MRTLVVHTGGIGDFLLACPALARLATAGPLEMAGQTRRLELALSAGIAERVWSLESVDFSTLFSDPSPRLIAFASRFDRAVVWMRDDGRIAEALRFCGVKEVQCFAGLPPADWKRHASEYYLECLEFREGLPMRLGIRAESGPSIIIHPGSGGAAKNWPIEDFRAIDRALARRDRQVAWCVGPAEERLRLPVGVRLVCRESLVELSRVLAAARLYVGNDSGITHLAAAAGCPVVAIFGPTDPAVWAPRGEHVRVVHTAPWPAPEAVLDAAGALLECPQG